MKEIIKEIEEQVQCSSKYCAWRVNQFLPKSARCKSCGKKVILENNKWVTK